MKGTWSRAGLYGLLTLSVCLALGPSRRAAAEDGDQVDEQEPPNAGHPFPTDAAPVEPTEPDWMLQETQLVPVERTRQSPPDWAGNQPPSGVAGFIAARLAEHRQYLQPFLDSSVFPDVSSRLENLGGWNPRNNANEWDQYGYFSLYYLEFYAPLFTVRDSETVTPDRFRVNLRVPIMLAGLNVLTFFGSANIPTSGLWTNNGGASMYVGYAHGGVVSLQLRAGFGDDELVGELPNEAPIAVSFLYDGAIATHVGDHAELIAQVDGRKLIGVEGATFRVFPGVRFFPLAEESLSIGLSALYWMDDFNPGGVGALRTRRIGGYIDAGYTFL